MPAFQKSRGVQTVHEKFQTDRAVHSQRLRHALMCTQHRKRQTRNTLVAVEVILSATHAADATAVTVELAFGSIIIEEAAGAAEVIGKCDCASDTVVAHWLPSLARGAYDLLHLGPIQLMRLFGVTLLVVLLVVVAMSTPEDFAAAS